MQIPFVFLVLWPPLLFLFPCKLVLLSSLLINYARFTSHYTIVLHSWPILFPLKLPTIYPHLSINSRLCEVCPYLAFGVSMSFPPLPWFFSFSLCYSGSKNYGRSALGSGFFTLSIRYSTFPSNYLESTASARMTSVPAADWRKDPRVSSVRIDNGSGRYWKGWSDSRLDEGEHQCTSSPLLARVMMAATWPDGTVWALVHISRFVFLHHRHNPSSISNNNIIIS